MCLCQCGNTDPSVTMALTFPDWAWLIIRILQSLDLCFKKDNFWACLKSSRQIFTWVPSWVSSSPLPPPLQENIDTWNEHLYNKTSVHWGLWEWFNLWGDWVVASDAWLKLEINCVEIFSAMISFIEWIALSIQCWARADRQHWQCTKHVMI